MAKLPEIVIQTVVDLRKSGKQMREIAQIVQLPKSTVATVCRRKGLTRMADPFSRVPEGEISYEEAHERFWRQRAIALHHQECTPAQIGERLGQSAHKVAQVLRHEFNLEPHSEPDIISTCREIHAALDAYMVKRNITPYCVWGKI